MRGRVAWRPYTSRWRRRRRPRRGSSPLSRLIRTFLHVGPSRRPSGLGGRGTGRHMQRPEQPARRACAVHVRRRGDNKHSRRSAGAHCRGAPCRPSYVLATACNSPPHSLCCCSARCKAALAHRLAEPGLSTPPSLARAAARALPPPGVRQRPLGAGHLFLRPVRPPARANVAGAGITESDSATTCSSTVQTGPE